MMEPNPRPDPKVTDKVAEAITPAEELAYELRIEEVMAHDPQCVLPDMKMHEVLEVFRQRRISGAPVLSQNGSLVGVLSIEDLIRALRVSDLEASVQNYMSQTVI